MAQKATDLPQITGGYLLSSSYSLNTKPEKKRLFCLKVLTEKEKVAFEKSRKVRIERERFLSKRAKENGKIAKTDERRILEKNKVVIVNEIDRKDTKKNSTIKKIVNFILSLFKAIPEAFINYYNDKISRSERKKADDRKNGANYFMLGMIDGLRNGDEGIRDSKKKLLTAKLECVKDESGKYVGVRIKRDKKGREILVPKNLRSAKTEVKYHSIGCVEELSFEDLKKTPEVTLAKMIKSQHLYFNPKTKKLERVVSAIISEAHLGRGAVQKRSRANPKRWFGSEYGKV
jgi:hypothetical protein